MDDRQRQFAQFATALNQYANSGTGNGERGPRDRSGADGRSSTGSTSSGSSSSSGNAAALWGDLSRAFQFNYPGLSSTSGWPPPSTHQGGAAEFHRYGPYGGFNEGPPDNRGPVDNRSEMRRVPSKGETKATPPLPAGLSPNVGSALASLQQFVGIPNDEMYRTILAQHYATATAAAAFSAMPSNARPSLSPIPPSAPGRSSLSPTAGPPPTTHGSPPSVPLARHHPQYQRQRQSMTAQPKASPPLSLLSTVGGHVSASPDGGVNGEYLEPMMRGEHPAQVSPMMRGEHPPQVSPMMRKDRVLDHQGGFRPSPNPTPPKSSPISPPMGRLTPHQESEREQHSFYSEKPQQHYSVGPPGEVTPRGPDTGGGRSGSESEGDHRVRHRRKQDQPRRQTVIYSNPGSGYSGPPMEGGSGTSSLGGGACNAPMSASAEESSSDDSQGYDNMLPRSLPLPNNNNNHPPITVDALLKNGPPPTQTGPGHPMPSNTPPSGGPQLPISQAMSHALSHPFLAAHLNASSHNDFLDSQTTNVPKIENQNHPFQYIRGEYERSSPSPEEDDPHCYNKDMDEASYLHHHHQKALNNMQYQQHQQHHQQQHHQQQQHQQQQHQQQQHQHQQHQHQQQQSQQHMHYKAAAGSNYLKNVGKEMNPYYRREKEAVSDLSPAREKEYSNIFPPQHSHHMQHSADHPREHQKPPAPHYDNADLHSSSEAVPESRKDIAEQVSYPHTVHQQSRSTTDSLVHNLNVSGKGHGYPHVSNAPVLTSDAVTSHTFTTNPQVPTSVTVDRVLTSQGPSTFQYERKSPVVHKSVVETPNKSSCVYSERSGSPYIDHVKNGPPPSRNETANSERETKDSSHDTTNAKSGDDTTSCVSNSTSTTSQSSYVTTSCSTTLSSNVKMPSVPKETGSKSEEVSKASSPTTDSTPLIDTKEESTKPPTSQESCNRSSPAPSTKDKSDSNIAAKKDDETSTTADHSETKDSNMEHATSPVRKTPERESLVNGTSSPSPDAGNDDIDPKVGLDMGKGLPTQKEGATSELVNGNLDHILSPTKSKKRRTECELVEDSSTGVCESKRRTRQKRPVSYVEDETDPVLEMNEDMYPLLSPVKKRGRKCKEKSEVESPSSSTGTSVDQSVNSNITSKDIRVQVYSPMDNSKNFKGTLPGDLTDNSASSLQARDRLLHLSGKVPPSIAKPLHIDTTGPFRANVRGSGNSTLAPPQPVITPTSHSPDVYDFNDGEGDTVVRGGKGKRGRKRGSPKKQGRVTPEYMRSGLSPRYRDGCSLRSPRSPRFFMNARSHPEGMMQERLRIGSIPSGVEGEFNPGDGRISNGSSSSLSLTPQDLPCHFPGVGPPSLSPQPNIPLTHPNNNNNDDNAKPPDVHPPLSLASHRGASPAPMVPLGFPQIPVSSNSKIVDEVEKQLAALHKEHLPEIPLSGTNIGESGPVRRQPDPVTSSHPVPLCEKKPTPVTDTKPDPESKPVHKPMLSVIPLEQLTYEGLRNKSVPKRDHFHCNDLDRLSKSPSGFFPVVGSPFGVSTDHPGFIVDDDVSHTFNSNAMLSQGPSYHPIDPLATDSPSPSGVFIPTGTEKLNLVDIVDPSQFARHSPDVDDLITPKRGFPDRKSPRAGEKDPLAMKSTEIDFLKCHPDDPLREKDPLCIEGCKGALDPTVMDRVAASIPMMEQSVHVVSVSDTTPTLGPGGRKRPARGRPGAGASSADGEAERPKGASKGENDSTNTTPLTTLNPSDIMVSTTTTTPNRESSSTTASTTNNHSNGVGLGSHAVAGEDPSGEDNHATAPTQPQCARTSPQPRLRRSRRGANTRIEADGSPTNSPPPLNVFQHPPTLGADSGSVTSTRDNLLDNRVPPSHRETLEDDLEGVTRPGGPSLGPEVSVTPLGGIREAVAFPPEEGETLEDIAKFLEATAPSSGGTEAPNSLSPKSRNSSFQSAEGSTSANTSLVSTDLASPPPQGSMSSPSPSYREGRPKRVARPPPQMNDGEMNDLLLLLNMEDEESEDEDYIPRETEEDTAEDGEGLEEEEEEEERDNLSLGNDLGDDVTEGEESEAELPPMTSSRKGKVCGALASDGHLTKGTGASIKGKSDPQSSSRKNLVVTKKGKQERRTKGTSRRKGSADDGTRSREGERGDRRGPVVRFPQGEETEVIRNAPDREDEDQERNRKGASGGAPFHLDISTPEGASRSGVRVGFNSTLHNNYDAFNKDLDWFCAFCKSYSHYWTLGDLFGPFYVKGLTVTKKSYPEVVEGQIPEMALSPHPCTPFATLFSDGSNTTHPTSKQKNKRTPKHESTCSESADTKKIEIGGCSPPSRFVPSATPARMLGRGGTTPNSPRVPLHSPLRSPPPTVATANPTPGKPSGAPGSGGGSSNEGSSSSSPQGTECWLHESCILWTSGVTTVNSKLYGLENALLSAQDSVCTRCGDTGATVSCLKRGCAALVHVPCAHLLRWTLDATTFQSFCPKHAASSKGPNSTSRKGSSSPQKKKDWKHHN